MHFRQDGSRPQTQSVSRAEWIPYILRQTPVGLPFGLVSSCVRYVRFSQIIRRNSTANKPRQRSSAFRSATKQWQIGNTFSFSKNILESYSKSMPGRDIPHCLVQRVALRGVFNLLKDEIDVREARTKEEQFKAAGNLEGFATSLTDCKIRR